MRGFWGRGGGVPQGFAFMEAWRRGGSATGGAEGGTKLELELGDELELGNGLENEFEFENGLEVSPGRTPLPGV